MPMMASCGILARFPRIIEKIAAPMKVNSRLTQYTDGAWGSPLGERQQDRNRRPERCNLREREIDEDDPALDDVHAQIGVDPGQDETGDKRRGQEVEDFTYRQPTHGYRVPVCFIVETKQVDVVVEER